MQKLAPSSGLALKKKSPCVGRVPGSWDGTCCQKRFHLGWLTGPCGERLGTAPLTPAHGAPDGPELRPTCPCPDGASGPFSSFLMGRSWKWVPETPPFPGPGTLSVNTLGTQTLFLGSPDGPLTWVEPEDGDSPCLVYGGGTAQWGCWIRFVWGP